MSDRSNLMFLYIRLCAVVVSEKRGVGDGETRGEGGDKGDGEDKGRGGRQGRWGRQGRPGGKLPLVKKVPLSSLSLTLQPSHFKLHI
jgi:hypothetical protein